MLPAENASGNWVKVVQRIPVRIKIDNCPGNPALRAGMSADVSIDTGHRRWQRLCANSAEVSVTRAVGASYEAYETKFELTIVVLCSMAGTLMQASNSTIANVALPYMQGSLRPRAIRSPGY